MFSFFKSSLMCLTLGAGLVSMGCESSGSAMAPASHEMAMNAVACDKCAMVWVKSPVTVANGRGNNGNNIVGYATSEKMECPDCRDAVSNFFATGKLQHDCKACGGNMAICAAH